MTETDKDKPRRLAILGAGPVGLDAALAGLDAGYEVHVYEAGTQPASNVRDWGHVRLFSPWSMNISPRMRAWSSRLGLPLQMDPDACPTGDELCDRLLDPLWTKAVTTSRLHLRTHVVAVGRRGVLKHEEIGSPDRGRRPFRILLRHREGREWVEEADVVLDCTGKYGSPNPLGDGGIPAVGEAALDARIHRRIPDLAHAAEAWKGKTILLAGSGHSAQTAARELIKLVSTGTRVIWALRKTRPDFGVIADDPLSGRRELSLAAQSLASGGTTGMEAITGVVVDSLSMENGRIEVWLGRDDGGTETVRVDQVLALTGGVGDHSIYRQLQVHECYATSGPMKLAAALLGSDSADCLDQDSHGVEALRSPEPDFFMLGDKSYGRNNTFLLRIGWQQVSEVFGELSTAP